MKKYFSTIKRLWLILKDFRKHFYIQLIAIIANQGLGIITVLLMAKTLDSLFARDTSMLLYILISYVVINITQNRIGHYATLHEFKYLTSSVQQYLQEYSFKNVFRLNVSQYSEDHSAIKLQNVIRGENAAEDIMSNLMLTIIPIVTQTLFGLIAIAFYSKLVALWCLITLVIVIAWTNKFSREHKPFVIKNMDNFDKQRKIRTEAFQHLSLIKLFSAESAYLYKYLKNRLLIMNFQIAGMSTSATHSTNRALFMLSSRTGAIIIVIRQFLAGGMTTGSVFAVWRWMTDIYSNIQSIVKTLRQMPIRFVELEKYLDIIDSQPLFTEGGSTLFKSGDIIFSNIELTYNKAESASLRNLNFTISEGQKVALVGVSGGGKSSMVKLLLRAYDYNTGSIKIGGTELRDFDYRSLRSHIGYVDQHVDLFDTSIKDNLLLGIDREVSDAELEEVAKKARITQFYDRLGDNGLDTIIGERGIKLSGGERQRVGIARALIRNPDILIFDEATSALDTENESFIKEAIDEASKGRTTIIIAHRLSTVRDADKIIVMDKGTVVAEGTHDELLINSTHYQTLVAHQLSE